MDGQEDHTCSGPNLIHPNCASDGAETTQHNKAVKYLVYLAFFFTPITSLPSPTHTLKGKEEHV